MIGSAMLYQSREACMFYSSIASGMIKKRMRICSSSNTAKIMSAEKYIETKAVAGSKRYRARSLAVRTSPSRGEDRRFKSGRAHLELDG